MKSDSDFANPYERDLYAQEEKIKDLTQRYEELKSHREKWTPLNDKQAEKIGHLEEKLRVAIEALGEAYELIRSTSYTIDNNNGNRCMDGNEYIWIDRGIIVMKEALQKIKGTK
jgi:hypothetical protein